MRTQATAITGSSGVCTLAHRNSGGMKGTLLHLSGMILLDFSHSEHNPGFHIVHTMGY